MTTLNRHYEYLKHKAKWTLIKDLLEGEEQIKSRRTLYLPFPVSLPTEIADTEDFKRQYQIYLDGAHFVGYTGQAVEDLVASVFSRDPIIDETFPEELEYLGLGDTARELTETIVSFGRAFLLVDYPTVAGIVSRQEEVDNKLAAYYVIYAPIDILDWREKRVGGQTSLEMILVREEFANEDGDFEIRYRQLEMIGGVYTITIYDESGNIVDVPNSPVASGATFTSIPGVFVGSTSNGSRRVETPPVLGIANTNLKHYQNTAELQHSITYIGHPMIAITGAPSGFIEEMNKGSNKITVGASNSLIIEGEAGAASLLQISSELVHFKQLEQLEKSMAEQGYRLKSDKAGVESGDALRIRNSGDTSKLASIATQIEKAVQSSMLYINSFMGTSVPLDFKFELVKDYLRQAPDPTILANLEGLVSGGRIPDYVLYDYMVDTELLSENTDYETLRSDSEAQDFGFTEPPVEEGDE